MKDVIIVVDDIEEHLILTKKVLETMEIYEVITCTDVDKALRAIVTYNRRLILVMMDLHMPGKNGVTAIKTINHEYPIRRFKILVVSAIKEKAILDVVKELKIDGFILKPFQHTELKDRIKKLFSQGSSQGSSQGN